MNYDEFFEVAKRLDLKLSFDDVAVNEPSLLSNEALFHLPFLSMVILVLAKGASKPKSSELGQTVGECLEKSLPGFKGSSQHIGWSANLRMRTIRALSFLEIANLAEVNQHTKGISATILGRSVLDRAMNEESNLSQTLAAIERVYRNYRVDRQAEMRLE